MSPDLLARLRLVRSPGVGPVTFRQLLRRFGNAEAALEVDEIVRPSGASAGEVQLVLLELDLGGRLGRHAGGKVSLAAA